MKGFKGERVKGLKGTVWEWKCNCIKGGFLRLYLNVNNLFD